MQIALFISIYYNKHHGGLNAVCLIESETLSRPQGFRLNELILSILTCLLKLKEYLLSRYNF